MKIKVIFTMLLIIIASIATAWDSSSHSTISKVIDGDSFFIMQDGKRKEVRLYGIDAPEHGQSFGTQAAQFVKSNALYKEMQVEQISYDKHGRMIAIIHINDQSLQSMLVENGFAWVYPRYCKRAICDDWLKLQEKAKQERKGLWKKNNPMPPWQWRRNK